MLVCGVQDSQSSLLVQVGPGENLYYIDPITWWLWRSSCPKREHTSETRAMESGSAEMPRSDAGVHIAWDPWVVRGEGTEGPQAKHLLPLGSPLLCLEEGKLFGRSRASCSVSRLDHEHCLESYTKFQSWKRRNEIGPPEGQSVFRTGLSKFLPAGGVHRNTGSGSGSLDAQRVREEHWVSHLELEL